MKSHFDKKPIKLFVFCALIFAASSAQAARIVNLSDKPQVIEVRASEGYESHTIAPDATFERIGDVWVRFNNREVRVEYDREFAIWSDTVFGPQRRLNRFNNR